MNFSSSPGSSGSGSPRENSGAIFGRQGRALYERRGPTTAPTQNINIKDSSPINNPVVHHNHNVNTSCISFFGRSPLPSQLTPGQILRRDVRVEDLTPDDQLMMGNILKLYRVGIGMARNSSQARAQESTNWSPNCVSNGPQSPTFQFPNYFPMGGQNF